jgi:serine/threonine protein kinase
VQVLKEVRALQRLHHRNIVDYKHSWLETYQHTDFGPKVPCLFLLMEYANRGTLADLIWPKASSAASAAAGGGGGKASIAHHIREQRRLARERVAQFHGTENKQKQSEAAGDAADAPQCTLSEREVWRFFIDTLLGLRHLHRLGIIHVCAAHIAPRPIA